MDDDESERFDECSMIYDYYYCTECGCDKLCIDRDRNEIYCSRCGLVIDDDEIAIIERSRDLGEKIVRNKKLASKIGGKN